MVSWFVALMELVQLNCRMKELFKHDYCYFIIKINLRNINFKKRLGNRVCLTKTVEIVFLHSVATCI